MKISFFTGDSSIRSTALHTIQYSEIPTVLRSNRGTDGHWLVFRKGKNIPRCFEEGFQYYQ